MASIKGILKLSPGVNMRLYFPNTVVTAIEPCCTLVNDVKIVSAINTIIKMENGNAMVNKIRFKTNLQFF
jgi:hypothetical protein